MKTISICGSLLLSSIVGTFADDNRPSTELAWKKFVGKAGADGWRVNVIQPDPNNHGPDGFNPHDWNGDGNPDVMVNYEEGGYSRLYFNPGKNKIRSPWSDYIQLEKHGKCEDSCIGDLDNDGDIDYVANGGHIYFNPGKKRLRDANAWVKMTLFQKEARTPVVSDIDDDGLNDLVVGATTWYKQPSKDKTNPSKWKRYELGKAKWPMNTTICDMDGDGDDDILVQERRREGLFYYENPGKELLTRPWPVQQIDSRKNGMFMAIGDVNGDRLPDLVKASHEGAVHIYIRINEIGSPKYKTIEVPQPKQSGNATKKPKPKGIAIMEINGDPTYPEIVVIPEYAAQLWYLTMSGDGMSAEKWSNTLIDIPGSESRKKMDNAFLVDLDGDGDMDIATTEENGGWGIIWFENPAE